MSFRRVWLWAALLGCALPGEARELTLDEALSLAREQGMSVVLARGRVEEARARQVQAGRRFQENPVAEVNGGYRRAEDGFLDFEMAVSQGFDPARRRSARMAGARAAVERAEAEVEEARRLLLREVRTAFVRQLAATERIALLARSREAADELLRSTERRSEAGEATDLERNRARTVAAQARSEQGAARAEAMSLAAGLASLLGLPAEEAIEVRGPLEAAASPDLPALLAGLDRRPDLRALAAELREAEAEILLGKSLARPDLGARAGVAREEGAEIVTAGLVVTLPIHNKGQETVAAGSARAAALRQALETARASAEAEVRGLHAALAQRLAAVRELEQTALPALDDNESLAEKSFEAGEIDLGELLLIRREILETRLARLERLLDAALARFELESAAGALP